METKHLAATIKATKDDGGPGSFTAILSAPTLDRDGEIIAGGAFNPLPGHINIDLNHSLKAEDIVASGRPFYDGDTLKIEGTFASTAKGQEIRSLVTEGHLRSLSVAFANAVVEKAESGGPPTITSGELLNATFAAIPANRDALVLAAKATALVGEQGPEIVSNETLRKWMQYGKVGARNSAADAKSIQSAHDALVDAGATCVTAMTANGVTMSDHSVGTTTFSVTPRVKSTGLLAAIADYVATHPEDEEVQAYLSAMDRLEDVAPSAADPTVTDPEHAAAQEAAADAPADVQVALANAELALAGASLAL